MALRHVRNDIILLYLLGSGTMPRIGNDKISMSNVMHVSNIIECNIITTFCYDNKSKDVFHTSKSTQAYRALTSCIASKSVSTNDSGKQ